MGFDRSKAKERSVALRNSTIIAQKSGKYYNNAECPKSAPNSMPKSEKGPK